MDKFIIVPKLDWKSEPITAKDELWALASFAATMDTDMNLYFEAVREEDFASFMAGRRFALYKTHVINFMAQIASLDFNIPEDAIDGVAEEAFDIYSEGDGHTEYEAVEEAVSRYKERNK